MNNFDVKRELIRIRKKYKSYCKDISGKDVSQQNAIANLYSVYIKRELNKIWHIPMGSPKAVQKINTYLLNWYKIIKRFKNSIK